MSDLIFKPDKKWGKNGIAAQFSFFLKINALFLKHTDIKAFDQQSSRQ